VQGQLRGGPLSFVVETACAHCERPIQIEIDSQLAYRVLQEDAEPVLFVPLIDLTKLDDPSIIDAF
jgi:hypothetical protein